MRRSVLTVILISVILCCTAEEYTISLAGRKLSQVLPGYFIEDVYLSQREDSCLGYINPLGPTRYNFVFFEKNIRAEMKEFFMLSMPKKADLLPLIIRVNRIYMFETTNGVREYTCLDLSLSFIYPIKGGLKEDFTSAISVSVYQKDVPESLSAIIVNAIEQCISQYTERLNKGLIDPRPLTPEQVSVNPLQEPDYFSCSSAHRPVKRIYRSWFDFRDNIPDTTLEFKILHNYNPSHPKLAKAYLKFTKGSEPNEIWGFSEGDSVYINGGKSFSLLTNEGGLYITYSRSAEYTREVVSAAIFGSVLGGLLGASIIGGIAAASSDPNLVQKFKIDLFDGKLIPYEFSDYTMVSSKVVFYLSSVSYPKSSLSIYIDGKHQCDLLPGKYFKLDLSCHHSTANVQIISTTGGERSKTIPLKLFNTDVYLLKVKRNHALDFDHLFDQMKKDILGKRTKENTTCRAEIF